MFSYFFRSNSKSSVKSSVNFRCPSHKCTVLIHPATQRHPKKLFLFCAEKFSGGFRGHFLSGSTSRWSYGPSKATRKIFCKSSVNTKIHNIPSKPPLMVPYVSRTLSLLTTIVCESLKRLPTCNFLGEPL